jgi:L-threonylcarbamoyladenylate synthase
VVRATQTEIEKAVETLRAGDLVVFPTETVYGLGANAANPAAVRKIFEVKGRPRIIPVIVHLDNPALSAPLGVGRCPLPPNGWRPCSGRGR